MSIATVGGSIAAALCADAATASKPDKPATERPSRPFSQTRVLVDARQMAGADNTAAGDARASRRAADKSVSSSGAAPGPDVSRERARTTTPASGHTQGLDALMQAAAWDTQVGPVSARSGRGQNGKPANLDGAAVKAPASQGRRSALAQQSVGSLTDTKRGKEAKESAPADVGASVAAGSEKGGSSHVAQAVRSTGQASDAMGKPVETASKQAVRGSQDALSPEKSAATVNKERTGELKQVQAKAVGQQDVQEASELSRGRVLQSGSVAAKESAVETKAAGPQVKSDTREATEAPKSRGHEKTPASTTDYSVRQKQTGAQAGIRPNEPSNAQQPAESEKNPVSRAERAVPQNPERIEADNGKPFPEALQNLQQSHRGMNSNGRAGPVVSGESAQSRQASGGAVSAIDGKEVSVSPSGDHLMAQSEQGMPGVDKSVASSRPVADQTPAGGGLGSAASRASAPSVSEQIRDSLHASLDHGERQIVIRLRPPELGSVLVRFQEQNEQLHGVLEVSRGDTRHEVEQALPQVLRSLQEAGIQIRKFDVTVSDQSEKEPGGRQLYQDAWPQQQGSDRQPGRPQRSNLEFRTADSESSTAVCPPAGRIDMLA